MLANDTPCLPNAGSATTFAIPKAELAAWTAASERSAPKCREWHAGDCYTTTPRPVTTQMAYWPACVNHACSAVTSPPR